MNNEKEIVSVWFTDDHPNGFPGGSPKQVAEDYNIEVTRWDDGEVQITGNHSDVHAYLEAYALAHLLENLD